MTRIIIIAIAIALVALIYWFDLQYWIDLGALFFGCAFYTLCRKRGYAMKLKQFFTVFSRRRRPIVIEPNPNAIRAVFERSRHCSNWPAELFEPPATRRIWPTDTWFQRRREMRKR